MSDPLEPQPDPDPDPNFLERADTYIALANEHVGRIERGRVAASLMYGAARFGAFTAACWSRDANDLREKRDETLKYFLEQYRSMLEENLDDYIGRFDDYMRREG